jgi:hypothetical protein
MERQNTILDHIGKVLRDQSSDLTQASLPERLVELIRRLEQIELSQANSSIRDGSRPK